MESLQRGEGHKSLGKTQRNELYAEGAVGAGSHGKVKYGVDFVMRDVIERAKSGVFEWGGPTRSTFFVVCIQSIQLLDHSQYLWTALYSKGKACQYISICENPRFNNQHVCVLIE